MHLGVDDDYLEAQDRDHDADEESALEKPLAFGEFLDTIWTVTGFEVALMRTDN